MPSSSPLDGSPLDEFSSRRIEVKRDAPDEAPAGHYGPSFTPRSYLPGYPAPGYTPDSSSRWSKGSSVARRAVRPQAIAAILGAVLLIIGSRMTWASGTAAGNAVSVNGSDKDGPLTTTVAILTLIMGALLLWRSIRGLCIAITVLGAIATTVAVVDIADVRDGGKDAVLAEVHLNVASGLWLVLIAALVVTAAGIGAIVGARRIPLDELDDFDIENPDLDQDRRAH